MKTNTSALPARRSPGQPPPVAALIAQFRASTPYHEGWDRLTDNDSARYNHWPNQWKDCKKRNTMEGEAFPWEGASDQRPMTADDVIIGNVGEMFESFWRAWISPKAGLTEESNYAVKLADHIVNVLCHDELVREVQLSAQYREQYGWMALHPYWDTTLSLEPLTIRLEDMAANLPPEMGDVLQTIRDPAQEDAAVDFMAAAWQLWAARQTRREVTLPELPKERLRRAVRELRETGKTTLPVPRLARNQPTIRALKPWVEFIFPTDCTDLESAPAVFQREYLTEVQLRERVATRGWNPAWVEEAVKQKGKISAWTLPVRASSPPTTLSQAISATGPNWIQTDRRDETIEVVYAVYRQVDDDNVAGVYVTVLHPSVGADGAAIGASYAWDGLLPDVGGQYPYVVGQRELNDRAIGASRGVPEVVYSWQLIDKVQLDSLIDWTSIGVIPPLNTYELGKKVQYRFAPAAKNPCTPGREPQLMQVSAHGAPVVFELMDRLGIRVDHYFGRDNPKLMPGAGRSRRQLTMVTFLLTWVDAINRLIQLCQRHMDDAEFSRVTGAPPGWLEQRRFQPSLLGARLQFDIRELDPEYVQAMLKAVNESVIPQDVAGVTDRAKWTRVQWRMINPQLARELVMEEGPASQKLFDEVNQQIALMALGNEPKYVENDPAAKQKIDATMKVVQANPIYERMLAQPGRFTELMQVWGKNLDFSIAQQQNKQVGRIGVKPVGPTGNET